jgi:hypothetical protein
MESGGGIGFLRMAKSNGPSAGATEAVGKVSCAPWAIIKTRQTRLHNSNPPKTVPGTVAFFELSDLEPTGGRRHIRIGIFSNPAVRTRKATRLRHGASPFQTNPIP